MKIILWSIASDTNADGTQLQLFGRIEDFHTALIEIMDHPPVEGQTVEDAFAVWEDTDRNALDTYVWGREEVDVPAVDILVEALQWYAAKHRPEDYLSDNGEKANIALVEFNLAAKKD